MVTFEDVTSSKGNFLRITDVTDDRAEKSITLRIHRPMIGKFTSWPNFDKAPELIDWSVEKMKGSSREWFLESSSHDAFSRSGPFTTLGRRIISGEVHWGGRFRISGEFSFIPNYWEWLKVVLAHNEAILDRVALRNALLASMYTYDRNTDIFRAFCEGWCSETNTLHTSVGEFSVSLWDLRTLGGLPILGNLYDEVIPCTEELTGVTTTKGRYIPESCQYLFAAFHHLQSTQPASPEVSIDKWIDFWFGGDQEYHKPPARRSKSKSSRQRSTHNPDGNVGASRDWTAKEERLFVQLGIRTSLQGETYLAAFLSCWLCVFVFPDALNLIRPGTFKVASMMASGQKFSLAVPVLACIYRGLNKITQALNPGSSDACFPAHYVYGWLVHYFGTHHFVANALPGPHMVNFSGEGGARFYDESTARLLIHRADNASWDPTMVSKNKTLFFVDDGKSSASLVEHFVSIRSSHLTLRRGNQFTVEPYSPHRFGRQFGFCQDMPGNLNEDIRSASLDDGLELFRTCTKINTRAKATFHSRPVSLSRHISHDYEKWWSTVHARHLENNAEIMIQGTQADASRSKKIGQSGEMDVSPTVVTPPLVLSNVKTKETRVRTPTSSKTRSSTSRSSPLVVKVSSKETGVEGSPRKDRGPSRVSVQQPKLSSIIVIDDEATTKKRSRSHSRTLCLVDELDCERSSDENWKHAKRGRESNDNECDLPKDSQTLNDILGGGDAADLGDLYLPSGSELKTMTDEFEDALAEKASHGGKQHDEMFNFIPDTTDRASQGESGDTISCSSHKGDDHMFDTSTFDVLGEISAANRQASLSLGRCLLSMMASLSFEKVTSFMTSIDQLCNGIAAYGVVDPAPLRQAIEMYVAEVKKLLELESSAAQRIASAEQNEKLETAELRLVTATSNRDDYITRLKSSRADLEDVRSKATKLREELAQLEEREEHLNMLISENEMEHTKSEGLVNELEKQLSSIKDIPTVSALEHASILKLRENLKKQRSEWEDFAWTT